MTNKQDVYTEEWKSLPWKEFEKTLFHLQHRLYKASKKKDIAKCKKLQSLILGSACSRYLAVRQVTQINFGKRTAGVDGLSSLTPKERLKLSKELKSLKDWTHQPLRRVFIRKLNGELKPLGIPTLKDRAMQCLIKYALEPYYEANASNGSWGFRPGRSPHDVQKNIFTNLNTNANGHTKIIFKLNIEDCFDKLNHEKLLSLIVLPVSAKKVIRSALKAGVLKERLKTFEGTPQRGVLSPLLRNIALNGIEDLHNEIRGSKSKQRGIKYADDMIFFLESGEDPELLRSKLDKFLMERGLKIKESKTQLVKNTEGFDFLGWHFRVKEKNHKFVSYPSKKNRKAVIKKIKVMIKDSRLPWEKRLSKVKIIYRGWRNYHKYSDMTQVNTWSISEWVYKFGKKRTSMNKDLLLKEVKEIFNGHSYKINGHISAQSHRSFFDGDWIYWSKR
jgi:group II intron reverse transcriptase/maturase